MDRSKMLSFDKFCPDGGFSSKLFSKGQIFDVSRLKAFEDDNSKFDENDRKFAIRVENTV